MTDLIRSRIDELLETLESPEAAYVVRSRLDRVLLQVASHVASERKFDADRHGRIQSALSDVDGHFHALRRRSEPFGESWIANLRAAKSSLALLRDELAD